MSNQSAWNTYGPPQQPRTSVSQVVAVVAAVIVAIAATVIAMSCYSMASRPTPETTVTLVATRVVTEYYPYCSEPPLSTPQPTATTPTPTPSGGTPAPTMSTTPSKPPAPSFSSEG